ncbi:Lar family restriction alleviation protein [Collimonas pratensis]|uniref:Restriction alleviation Lar family protein n=1 Tax=Collimonas pratensis TaxID=279113 RepID=A0ABM5Z494_9BURK|nr:Lar family restriction alleviation protein [Collimonas pratensis]AMP13704.1 restriction alleviation Lar family protein [Collimonas pratensis]
MSIELKPCPFCGGSAILQEHPAHTHAIAQFMPDHVGSATVECTGCNVGMINDTAALVAADWNTRTVQADPYSTTSDKYRAELYDEVWTLARKHGFANVTMAIAAAVASTGPVLAESQQELAGEKLIVPAPVCHRCGFPHVANPHPEAGKPAFLLKVGCQTECLPCLVSSRHEWSVRASKAEKLVRDYQVEGYSARPRDEKDL